MYLFGLFSHSLHVVTMIWPLHRAAVPSYALERLICVFISFACSVLLFDGPLSLMCVCDFMSIPLLTFAVEGSTLTKRKQEGS